MTSSLAALALGTPGQAPLPLNLTQVQATGITTLRTYVTFCQTNAKPEYVVDCLAERFDVAANAMGNYGDTADIYRALKAAAQDLAAVSRKYASPTMQPLMLHSQIFTTTRPIRPVAPANLPPSNAAATEVLEEAELTLLRSSTRSPNVLAFSQVAEIVGSAKVLLRAG